MLKNKAANCINARISAFRSGWRKPYFTISVARTSLSHRDSDPDSRRYRRSTRASRSPSAYCSPGRDCSRCRSTCSSPSDRRRCRCRRCRSRPSGHTYDPCTADTSCTAGPPLSSLVAAARSQSRSPFAASARIPATFRRSSSSCSRSRSPLTRLSPRTRSSRAKKTTKSATHDASPRRGSCVSLDPTWW